MQFLIIIFPSLDDYLQHVFYDTKLPKLVKQWRKKDFASQYFGELQPSPFALSMFYFYCF